MFSVHKVTLSFKKKVMAEFSLRYIEYYTKEPVINMQYYIISP